MIAGVDGCKSGWIAAIDDESGATCLELFPTFAELLDTDARLIVVDVPIGLMATARREADRGARGVLKHRACCVFSAPYRPVLSATSYTEACEIRQSIDGSRCSRQSYGIFRKIREVDELMSPSLQSRVNEGHPEVTFTVIAGGVPMNDSKKTAAGRDARLAALRPYFPEIDTRLATRRPRGVGRDDVLDAHAMLWTARRVATGVSRRLPEMEQIDERGLRAQILA